ncbi:hypothetical protein CDAR_116041 [Caerostris darwini]|uniref:Uncharacterized protein n=1 Tax=Caerostris darwini TaxID=1538125 RepID=A0AAV4ND31_9ARAC|nr:hypothetical protein CDAR_116041 [Caerostris darwini]
MCQHESSDARLAKSPHQPMLRQDVSVRASVVLALVPTPVVFSIIGSETVKTTLSATSGGCEPATQAGEFYQCLSQIRNTTDSHLRAYIIIIPYVKIAFPNN